MITIKLSNKVAYTLIAVLAILTISLVVYAFGGNNPSYVGHTFSEIEPPSGCSAGQILSWDGSNWVCIDEPTGWTCHWEESWLHYPDGGDIDLDGDGKFNEGNHDEKTACDVGVCQFKVDCMNCNPSDPTCSKDSCGSPQGCGSRTDDRNEYLYCCE